jgi:hypothetical protein
MIPEKALNFSCRFVALCNKSVGLVANEGKKRVALTGINLADQLLIQEKTFQV